MMDLLKQSGLVTLYDYKQVENQWSRRWEYPVYCGEKSRATLI
jgi:hypothetical protein